jgi:hypothetical protein
MIPCRLPIIFISSSEDPYDASGVCAPAFVLPHALPGTALSSVLDPSLPSPLESSGVAHRGPTSPQATLPTRLSSLLPRLHSLVKCGASASACTPLARGQNRRGAPRRVNTDGFACPNHQCLYFGITDAHIHALVGDGKHGHAQRIQTLRCQSCRTMFTARRHTPLYRLKAPSQQVAVVLTALGLWAGSFRSSAGLRLPPCHHHHLAIARWRARSDFARALFL